jgi:hypothetical protein
MRYGTGGHNDRMGNRQERARSVSYRRTGVASGRLAAKQTYGIDM